MSMLGRRPRKDGPSERQPVDKSRPAHASVTFRQPGIPRGNPQLCAPLSRVVSLCRGRAIDGFGQLLQARRRSDKRKATTFRVASLAKDNESGELAGKLDNIAIRATAELADMVEG